MQEPCPSGCWKSRPADLVRLLDWLRKLGIQLIPGQLGRLTRGPCGRRLKLAAETRNDGPEIRNALGVAHDDDPGVL